MRRGFKEFYFMKIGFDNRNRDAIYKMRNECRIERRDRRWGKVHEQYLAQRALFAANRLKFKESTKDE